MQKRILLFIRDLCLLFLLCYLLTVVVRRIIRFIHIHQQSLIHELDDTLINQLEEIKKQIELTKKFLQSKITDEHIIALGQLEKKVQDAEIEYKKNSHGLILLGPIGTIAIVLKERRIKALMMNVLAQLQTILIKQTDKKSPKTPIESIAQGILYNYQLLY